MTLAPGARIGPYEITAKLGEGGMGEVYRATDTKLDRQVAIKILPAEFTRDEERLARFEREAKLLAQLHHPNIASIFGLEESEGTRALVMELVEGPTLAERLEQGPLPFEESLAVALQIAHALEEAHDKGIVHRDLKPQNVKASVEGKVKVLDFGLAKAMDPVAGSSASVADLARSPTLMQSPTLTAVHGTQLGVILGTAAYMAPEQAKGFAVDKRADIWAFGVVLYEMLVGRSLFAGDSVTDTLAGVLKTEIDFSKLPDATPPAIRRLLRRCLERSPKNRLHDIADARIVIDEVLGGAVEVAAAASSEPPPSRARLAALLAAALVVGAVAGGLVAGRLGPASTPAASVDSGYAFRVAEPSGIGNGSIALSPDGRRLVYVVREEGGVERLWLRELDAFESRPLAGTEGARFPIFSPDGRDLAFQAQGELRRMPLAGGAVRQLASTGGQMLGGAWGPDGTLLIGNRRGVLLRIPAGGGSGLVPAVERSEEEGPVAIHAWPSFLPDGRRFVYLADGSGGADGESHRYLVGSLDGGPSHPLLRGVRSSPIVDPLGFLFFERNDQLIAQRFDFDRGELVGEAELVADRVLPGWDYHGLPVAASSNGALAYQTGTSDQQLEWVDAGGRTLSRVAHGEPLRNPRLSPDGRFVAFEIQDSTEERSIWVLDLERDVRTLLSVRGGRLSDSAAWSPDGRWVYFDTEVEGGWQIVRQPREGSPDPQQVLAETLADVIVHDVSPDGRWLLYSAPGSTSWDLFLLPLGSAAAEAELWLDSRGQLDHGRFSPDGRWLAFSNDESGRAEIYVRAVAGGDGRRLQISSRGGTEPAWSPDGRRIYFRTPENVLMSAAIEMSDGELAAQAAAPLFAVSEFPPDFVRSTYDPAPDGERLLVLRPVEDVAPSIFVRTRWRSGSGPS